MLKMFGLLFVKHILKNYMLLFSDFGAWLCPGSHRVPQATRIFFGQLGSLCFMKVDQYELSTPDFLGKNL